MIRHIVFLELRPNANGSSAAENARELKSRLDTLPARISEIKAFEVGIDYRSEGESASVVLVSDFDSLDTLESYRVHPDHQAVVDFIKQVTSDRRAVDYEVPGPSA